MVDGKLYGQDFDEIKASCLDSGELFTDQEFPADNDSIYFSKVLFMLTILFTIGNFYNWNYSSYTYITLQIRNLF